MPLYDYSCGSCNNRTEILAKIADRPEIIKCRCGGDMRQIIVLGHGGIHTDEPTWLRDPQVIGALQDTDAIAAGEYKQIETRGEYKRWLDDHGIIPQDKGNNIWMI